MGFLWSQQAVQTCILSKRWRTLWKNLPSPNFHPVGFKSNKQFICFVDSFLSHRENTKMVMFCLDWAHCTYVESEPTATWIHYALNFQPRSISIRIPHLLSITLPDSLFACNSMEALDLNIGGSSIVEKEIMSKPINLLNLKRLNLTNVNLNDELMKKLFLGCRRLEELILKHCSPFTSNVTIASHSLKVLVIDCCHCYYGFAFYLYVPMIVVIATMVLHSTCTLLLWFCILLSLHILDADLGYIRVDGMPSLINACIHYNQIVHCPQESGYGLLRALSNVSHLELIGKPYLKTTKSMSRRISVLKVYFSSTEFPR